MRSRLWLGIFTFVLLSTIAAAQKFQEQDQAQLKRQRELWYLRPRATPATNAFHLKMKALLQMATMNAAATSPAEASAQQWKSIGPASVNFQGIRSAGAASGLAIDPRNSKVVYASFAGGGLWKTTNGGNSWAPLTDQQPIMQTSSFAMDPNNPDTVYVGAAGGPDGGILKSTDGGATWSVIAGPFVGPFNSDRLFGGSALIRSIAIQPHNSSVLLVATQLSQNGVFRSADGGKTWNQVLTIQGRTVLFDPTNESTAYASLCDGFNAGIFKSTDGGASWMQLSTGLPASVSSASDCGLAISPSSPNILAVAFNNTTLHPTIFKTVDGGQHWAALTPAPDNMHAAGIFFSASNPDVIFAGSAALYRSIDGGASWQDITTGANGVTIHVDQDAFAFIGTTNQMFIGNDGGVFFTPDASASNINWTNLNNGLATLRIYPGFSIHPTDPTITFAGTQDEGTIRYSGSPDWTTVACGDSSSTAIDPISPNNVFVDCILADVQKSTDGGHTFSAAANGINTSDPMVFFPPLVIDPSNGATLYFGTDRVYQSTDHAASWTPISPAFDPSDPLNSIAVSPKDSNTVYATAPHSTTVWTSTNAVVGVGANWTGSNSGLPPRAIMRVIADPNDAHTAYVTLSGFSGFVDNAGHVFKSIDTGQSWVDISGNLPNMGANDLAIDPDVPGTMYLATDIGVFTTSNGGITWQAFSSQLPINVVFGIRLHQPTRTLRATTFGRGAWDLALAAVSGCATDVSGSIQITRSGYGYNFTTGRFYQTVTLTNSGSRAISGPISLVLDNLSSNATLFNADGATSCAAPLGSPFIKLSGPLNPGVAASVVLQFTDPTKAGITYTTRVLAGSGSR